MTPASSLAALSVWIDSANYDQGWSAELVTWGRLAKIGEEFGEVIAAQIGATGQNPRKGFTHTQADVDKELLDVALTALCAWEHMNGANGRSLAALDEHIAFVLKRAGLDGTFGKET